MGSHVRKRFQSVLCFLFGASLLLSAGCETDNGAGLGADDSSGPRDDTLTGTIPDAIGEADPNVVEHGEPPASPEIIDSSDALADVTTAENDSSDPASPPAGAEDELLINPGDPEIIELSVTGKQTVYVNFDGGTVRDCDNYCSDAPNNRSWAIGAHFGRSSVSFGAYKGGSTKRDEIMSKLRRAFSDYNVEFTTRRPTSGAYTMLVISPSDVGPNHGVAPLNCDNSNAKDIAFVYKIGNSSTAWIAQAGAHELGHSFGLAHVKSSDAIMHWASSGSRFLRSSIDTARAGSTCVGGSTQDAPAYLRSVLGVFTNEPEPFDGTFADDDGSVHENNIEKIFAAEITVGCGGGDRPRFCPTRAVTRAQMVVFLRRALDLPKSSTDYFDDDDDAWYEVAANAAAEADITRGCGQDRQFCGDRELTRGQMAAFMHRGLSLPPTSRDYFTDDDGSIFEDSINRMAAAGITSGCGAGRFCPDDPVSRGQMASFLARALDL